MISILSPLYQYSFKKTLNWFEPRVMQEQL